MDLISREAAIDRLNATPPGNWSKARYTRELWNVPSVPAVPLDKLVEFMAERYAVPCRAFDEPEKLFCGHCYEEGISNAECWKRYFTKMMEEQDESN